MSVIFWEFPGGPVAKDSTLPLQGAFVSSLVGELEPHKPRNYIHTHTHTHTEKVIFIMSFWETGRICIMEIKLLFNSSARYLLSPIMVENSLELCSRRVLRIRIREKKQMHIKQLEINYRLLGVPRVRFQNLKECGPVTSSSVP